MGQSNLLAGVLLLFLWKKSKQKSHRKTNTARFPAGTLIRLQYYCEFCCISLLSLEVLLFTPERFRNAVTHRPDHCHFINSIMYDTFARRFHQRFRIETTVGFSDYCCISCSNLQQAIDCCSLLQQFGLLRQKLREQGKTDDAL